MLRAEPQLFNIGANRTGIGGEPIHAFSIVPKPIHVIFCKMRIFVITGAGISAESGIPTFRGKDGYWRNFDPAKLATPEAFARDPKLVWEWYRERRQRIRRAQPIAVVEREHAGR